MVLQRQSVTNCLADNSKCESPYTDSMPLYNNYCDRHFKVTIDDKLIAQDNASGVMLLGQVNDIYENLDGVCATNGFGNKAKLIAVIDVIHFTTIPAPTTTRGHMGELWAYDKATKTLTIGYPPGLAKSVQTEFIPWLFGQTGLRLD